MVNVDLSVVGAILNETGRLKTSIPIDNMMLLGAYEFRLSKQILGLRGSNIIQ